MTTVEKIARRALDRLVEETAAGDVWALEAQSLRIITEAIEAGVRAGIMLAFTHPTDAATEMIGDQKARDIQ